MHVLDVSLHDFLSVNEGKIHIQDLASQQIDETVDVLSLLLRSIPLLNFLKVVIGKDDFEQLEVKRVRGKGLNVVDGVLCSQYLQNLVS